MKGICPIDTFKSNRLRDEQLVHIIGVNNSLLWRSLSPAPPPKSRLNVMQVVRPVMHVRLDQPKFDGVTASAPCLRVQLGHDVLSWIAPLDCDSISFARPVKVHLVSVDVG